jgi:hypothetical protein
METPTDKLQRLLKGVRAISPNVEVRLKPAGSLAEHYSVVFAVGTGAILFETDYDELDASLTAALKKLASISTRMMAVARDMPIPSVTDPTKKT